MTDGAAIHVDTDLILRLLLNQPPTQARNAEILFERAAHGDFTIIIHPAVLAEVVYVLASPRVGDLPRADVALMVRTLCTLDGVEVADLNVVLGACQLFEDTKLDWVDCLLLAHASMVPVFTFDQAMVKAGARPVPATTR